MDLFFEANISYYDSELGKPQTDLFFIDAMTFTEAEANITKYLTEFTDVKDFNIKSLKKSVFDDVIYDLEDDGFEWFEAKVKIKITGEKDMSQKYLVASNGVKEATTMVNNFLRDSQGSYRVLSVKFREIKDLVLTKKCCEECDTCESLYRILGFEEQKEIEKQINIEKKQ